MFEVVLISGKKGRAWSHILIIQITAQGIFDFLSAMLERVQFVQKVSIFKAVFALVFFSVSGAASKTELI